MDLRAWALQALNDLRDDAWAHGASYLPVDCPGCGRRRLEAVEGGWRCEKCGCNPVSLGGDPLPPEPEPPDELGELLVARAKKGG